MTLDPDLGSDAGRKIVLCVVLDVKILAEIAVISPKFRRRVTKCLNGKTAISVGVAQRTKFAPTKTAAARGNCGSP